jgi:hypothetical protein
MYLLLNAIYILLFTKYQHPFVAPNRMITILPLITYTAIVILVFKYFNGLRTIAYWLKNMAIHLHNTIVFVSLMVISNYFAIYTPQKYVQDKNYKTLLLNDNVLQMK